MHRSCKVPELQFLYMTILRSQIALFESQPRVRQGHQHLLPACSSIRTHLCVEATLCSAVFQCVAVSRQQNPLQLCGCDSLTLKRLKFLNFQNTPLESLRRNCRGSPTGSCAATALVLSFPPIQTAGSEQFGGLVGFAELHRLLCRQFSGTLDLVEKLDIEKFSLERQPTLPLAMGSAAFGSGSSDRWHLAWT